MNIATIPALLERARQRAQAEGLEAAFQEADAEDLPFPDAAFDVVLSTCGGHVRPRPEADGRRAAAGLPARRAHRHGQLGPRRLCRGAVPDHRPLPATAAGLKADMVKVARSFDVSDDDTLMLRQDYLEAVIHKPATP